MSAIGTKPGHEVAKLNHFPSQMRGLTKGGRNETLLI